MAITLEARSWKLEAGNSRGFTLYVAVIFMAVMLSFALTLSSLGYKQSVLGSSAVQSQYAFYAADAALECALYADQQLVGVANPFSYANGASATNFTCGDGTVSVTASCYNTGSCVGQRVASTRVKLDADTRCADITVYKPSAVATTYIFSQGYNVKCDSVTAGADLRMVSRGLYAHYQ